MLGNIKFFIYAAGFAAVLFVGYNAYQVIRENAILNDTIAIQQITIESQERTIENIQSLFNAAIMSLKERDEKVRQLEEDLENVLVDLGEDSKDLSPESIRNLLERLQ